MMLRVLALALFAIPASAPVLSGQPLRIGVFTLFHPTQLEIRPIPSSALMLECGHSQIILNGEPGHAKSIVRFANGHLLFGTDPVESITAAARDGGPADFILAIPGKITRRYHGILAISADAKQLIPVVSMDIETATASIVSAESPPGATIEALKAQAVVARSFLYAGSRHHDYDFCDTTHCQFLRQPPAPDSRFFAATRATRGLILTWRGAPLAAMYSSRCGGRTASLHDIGVSSTGYPYFAVECAYCRRHLLKWSRAVSAADAKKLAQSGESERLTLGREYGWSAVPGNRYTARASSTGVVLSGEGSGHGVGLCQYGAAGMAAEGASYGAILHHYYPETELASIPSSQITQP